MHSNEILSEISRILKDPWSIREGRKVPDTDSLQLGNDAVTLEATVIYADMADSTKLVNEFKSPFAAEIYKAYLIGACRVIRDEGGEITAFDGDRVMALFLGTSKNSIAVKAALRINFVVREINKLIQSVYPSSSFLLDHSIGIDTSQLLVAKTGIRKSNDLVWVGRAANYAAKLSAMNDEDNQTYITEDVYLKLNEASKFGGNPKKEMWEKQTWTSEGIPIYRSNWYWSF